MIDPSSLPSDVMPVLQSIADSLRAIAKPDPLAIWKLLLPSAMSAVITMVAIFITYKVTRRGEKLSLQRESLLALSRALIETKFRVTRLLISESPIWDAAFEKQKPKKLTETRDEFAITAMQHWHRTDLQTKALLGAVIKSLVPSKEGLSYSSIMNVIDEAEKGINEELSRFTPRRRLRHRPVAS